jgi:superfamily II DNA or RNA helicase
LINTEYRLGLTGTAFRTDKTDLVMNAVVGYKVFELPASKLIEDGYLFKPKIIFYSDYMTEEEIKDKERLVKQGLINETDNYNSAYEVFISKNMQRNALINKIVEENSGKRTLIVTKLVEHGKYLAEICGGYHIYGDTNLDERKRLMQDFRDDKFKILVMTLSIAQEGIDFPFLQILISAGGHKAEISTIQSLGRLLRLCEGKEQAVCYDFIDGHRFFKHASYLRKKAFRKEGHDIEIEVKQNL